MRSLRFSGHESFQCRNLWLKKGYDFIQNKGKKGFRADDAVIHLGVGNNMVSSIRFWMKAFGMVTQEDEVPTFLASYLLANEGKDPFLEDIGTLWLLHYHLVSTGEASIFSLAFNKFRKQRLEFTKTKLLNFLINICDEREERHSPNSIETDVGVFLKTYVRPTSKDGRKSIEDEYSALFIELDLVKRFIDPRSNEKEWYRIESNDRESLPIEVFFYSILDNESWGRSISLHKLLNEDNSPGLVFCLSSDAVVKKVKTLSKTFDGVVYKEDAGVRELQINKEFEKHEILDRYYGRFNT